MAGSDSSDAVKTDLELSHLTIEPGRSGRVEIAVTNNADVIDGITAIIDGINPDWIRLDQPLISLFPEASGKLALVFDIPATCSAGDYLVIVRIVSTLDADRQTVHDFWLTVTPAPALDVTATPRIVTGGRVARFTATVANTGNTTADVMVDALEPTREVDCTPDPVSLLIPQDQEAPVEIELRGKRPWFGDPVTRTVIVTARVGDVAVEELVTFRQRAKIPRGLLTALILASIVLLWALIFLFVITELRRTEDPAKAVGAAFLTGPDNIPLARVAAGVEGTVTASTTGAGIARITVEALRVTADGTLAPVGSAATGDDGTYSLQSLIPGTYKIRFSSAGYQTVWFAAGGDAATADDVRLGPLDVLEDLDVEMVGDLGELSGKIDVPSDAVGTPLTVTATQVVERDDGETGGAPVIPPVTTTDGNFTLSGLPTPATYLITVTGPGFQTQQSEQTVSGGQSTVMNTVQLSAATGAISGTVRDGDLRPIGGVAITARSGDLVIRSVTPTSGNVGQFEIIGLPTPQTYSITFEFPGYTASTIALSLEAGQNRTGVDVQLVGGSGRITGIAVGQDGVPIGGAAVRVLGDDVESTTTTLTTGGIGGGPGSFTVTDLPVPGNYTVSITAPGYQTETLSAFFFGGAEQNLGQVVLLPATSIVRGTVTANGAGLGETTITLSDGTPRTRVTTSASNPAGSYSFTGIAPGSYTAQFERSGFVTRVVSLRVEAGVDALVNVSLGAAP
jgi:hypothetical protein